MRRLELGLSQGQLADAVGITFQQIQKYEKGTNQIGANRLPEIARALDVPLAYFFEPNPTCKKDNAEEFPGGLMNDFLANRAGMNFMRAFCRISDRKLRRQIVDLVNTLAARRK